MVARGQEEEEVMDDRVGRVVAREARIRYMVACRRLQGRQVGGFWSLVPLGLGLGLAWTVSLVVHRCHWRMVHSFSWLEKLLEYPGTVGMTILGLGSGLGSGSAVVSQLGLGLGLPWFVLGWLHAVCMQWMQYDTAIQSVCMYCTVLDRTEYGTVRYCLTIWLRWNSNDEDNAQGTKLKLSLYDMRRATCNIGS